MSAEENTLSMAEPEPASRFQKIARTTSWVILGIFLLVAFTILKLPEDRIKDYALGMVNQELAAKGMSLQAARASLSFGPGISYVLKDVTLNLPAPTPPSHIDKVAVSPSLIGAILRHYGGTAWIENGDGSLRIDFSMNGNQISGSYEAKKLDMGKIGALAALASINGSALVSGEGKFSGDASNLATASGQVGVNLSKIVIDAQSIAGFSVPRLSISEGTIDLGIDKGKVTIHSFKLGKPGSPNSSDDIQANLTGDGMLGRNIDMTNINVKARFSLSQNVLKAFVLIDALLGPGKQADGSYAYQLSGPLMALNPMPLTGGTP